MARRLGFLQQGHDQRQKVSCHLGITLIGRMNAVGLHAAGNSIYVLEQKRQQRHVVLSRQQHVGLVELPDVVGSIVSRQRDTAQLHFGSGLQQRAYDLIEIRTRRRDGESAQTIVPAEGHDYQHWFQTQCVLQPIDTVFGGVSTDALIDDVVVVAAGGEKAFEIGWVALVYGVEAVAGGDAVAEADQGLFWGCG